MGLYVELEGVGGRYKQEEEEEEGEKMLYSIHG